MLVYDFLPDSVLHQIENLHEFLGVLVFDKWMGNADSRQVDLFSRAIEGMAARVLSVEPVASGIGGADGRQRIRV